MDGEALAVRVVERRVRALLEARAAAGDGHRAGHGGRSLWDGTVRRWVYWTSLWLPRLLLERVQHQQMSRTPGRHQQHSMNQKATSSCFRLGLQDVCPFSSIVLRWRIEVEELVMWQISSVVVPVALAPGNLWSLHEFLLADSRRGTLWWSVHASPTTTAPGSFLSFGPARRTAA
jgi:hypothetical protein